TPPRDHLLEELRMEEGFAPQVLDELRKKGHKISVADRWSFGSAKVIVREPESGTWMAGADPRREAYALGY
ncbi:MAG TPA: gamma-glutamyltransferase, partial [Candidatus Binatia bacterium]|nr:gamma-glutamyltransferase [Candidatus Binatia bacterium]